MTSSLVLILHLLFSRNNLFWKIQIIYSCIFLFIRLLILCIKNLFILCEAYNQLYLLEMSFSTRNLFTEMIEFQ